MIDKRERRVGMVLAGGESRRMGVDKLALAHPAGGTVLGAVVRAVAGVCDETWVLVAPSASAAVVQMERELSASVRLFHDVAQASGPLTAIAAAWRLVCHPALVVMAPGDVPGLSDEVLRRCASRFEELRDLGEGVDGVLVKRDGRAQPLLGVYDSRAGSHFEAAANGGEKRLMSALAAMRLDYVDATAEHWPTWWTRPIHTVQDYESWTREATPR